jgi:transcriptional regulator GlxA family with amidase domain
MGKRVDQRVDKVLQMMRADLREELSLTGLAHAVNLSVWRLSHIFRSDVGVSPIQYLKVLRLEKAKYLLETSFLSVKEITHRVGLNDESHFVRDFKKAYGLAPTNYRTLFKEGQLNGSDGRDNQLRRVSKQMAKAAKGSILPSLSLLTYLLYALDGTF